MNMIPIARSVQSIHGIGPNLANQKALQPAADREQVEYRRNAQMSDKDNNHLSSLNHNPASNRVDSGKAVRQFPARAVMQWDYVATREDELSALAGETILIAGDYKNAGWLWGARIINGQAGGFRLIPANYIEYLPEHSPVTGLTRSVQNLGVQSTTQTTPAQAAHAQQGDSPHKIRAVPLSIVDQLEYTPAISTHYLHGHAANPNTLPHHPPHLLGATSSGSSILTPSSSFLPTNLNPSTALGSIIHSTTTASAGNPIAAGPAPASDAHRQRERAPAAWDDDAADGAAYGVDTVGDPDDPYLDGMYEDETGLASVCC